MTHIALLQLATAILVGAIAVILGGKEAGVSSLLAGFSCVIPNTIFLLGVQKTENKSVTASMTTFYFFEAVKVILTVLLVIAVFWLYKEINWLSFIVSFIIVIKSYIFLLSKTKN